MQPPLLRPVVWLFALVWLIVPALKAQSPASVAGRAAEMKITGGNGPFASTGSARLLMSATDSSYGLVATSWEVTSSYGTASYSKTGTNSAVATFNDSVVGNGLRAAFTFTSATTGSFVTTTSAAVGYSQTGTFRLYNGQAPASVKGTTFDVQVQAGSYPLASYGSFKFKTDPTGNTYQIYGGYGVTPGSGTYVYTPGEAGKSSIVFQDALGGAARSQTLSWDTSTAGAYVVRDSATAAYQAGTFTVEAVSLPPVIITQPSGVTLNAGATGVLSVVASSTETISYQWRKGGVAIAGATGSSLVIGPAQSADAGSYSVAVTSSRGTVVSNAAAVKVNAAVATGVSPDSISGRTAEMTVLDGTPPFEAGEKYPVLFSSTDNTFGELSLSGDMSSSFGTMLYSKTGPNSARFEATNTAAGLTLVASLYFTSNTAGFYTLTAPLAPGLYETGTFRLSNGPAPASVKGTTFAVQIQAGITPFAASGSFKLKTDPASNTYQIYGDYGVNPSSGTYLYTQGESGKSSLVLSDSITGESRSRTLSWDSSSTGAYLASDAVYGAYQAGAFKVEAVSPPPVITTQPSGVTLNTGATGVLSVVASSADAPSYQWRKDGVAIAGATGSSLVIGPAQSADAGSYNVAVTSGMGTVLSNAAAVKVNAAVATGVAPDSISGRALELTAVNGTPPFEVGEKSRVLFSSTDNTFGELSLSGDMSSSFGTMLYNKTGPNSARFEATNAAVDLTLVASLYFTSNTVGFYTLTAPIAPGLYETGSFRLSNGPAPASVKGTTFAVQIQAGIPPFAAAGSFKLKTDPAGNTYQIYGGDGVPPSSGTYVYTPGEAGKSSIALQDSLTGDSRSQTLSWDSSSAGAYVLLDSSYGGYQAGTFKVEAVSLLPVITTQPGGLTLSAGGTGVLRVVASSTDPLSYQWRKGGGAIAGATAASLELNGVTELSAGTYDVLVTSAAGTVTSAQANLKVIVPATIVSQPTPLSSALGASAALSVKVTGTPPFTFTWKKDGLVLPAATSGTLFLSSVTRSDFGAYTVEVANSAGRATSSAATFSLAAEVAIASHPASVTTRAGAAATFTVVATGTEPLSYQWRKDGVLLPGATRSSYTVPMTTAFEAGAYEVFVCNDYGSATSNAAQLSIAGAKGISLLSMPGQPVTGTLTLVKGAAGNATAAIDPVDTQTARTTYQLLRLSGASSTQALAASALVPSGGTLSVPLRSFVESGTYAMEYIRQYADGSPAVKVLSEPFSVAVLSFDSAAGVYELLLEDSNQVIPDGAIYRGALLVTVTKSGSVSGKLLYNEAPELYGADDPARRIYTPVTRSFSGVFSSSQTATEKLVCVPKLGTGTQVGRQQLSLELDFTTSPISMSASVADRISVPAEISEEGALSAAPAVARNLTKLTGTTDNQTADISTAVGRYNIGSSFQVESNVSPGLNRRALVMTQVLASGRVLWTSRIEGHSGSGAVGLRLNDAGALVASFYEGRLTATSKQHHSNSLLAALQLDSLSDGSWTLRTSVGPDNGFVERHSSHVTKNNGRAEYSEAFEDGALETKDFNWSCVAQLDLSAENFCLWNGSTKAALFQHFSLTQAAAVESTPRILTLTLEDPAEGTPYLWTVSLTSTGAIRVTPQLTAQPTLTLRFDKVRGEFSGSYVSAADKVRRAIFGAALLDPAEDLLRAHGWVELNALPATKTAPWKLELVRPQP